MSKEEKRKLYACGSKYVTLEEVETWQKHATKRSVRRKYPSGHHYTIILEIVHIFISGERFYSVCTFLAVVLRWLIEDVICLCFCLLLLTTGLRSGFVAFGQ